MSFLESSVLSNVLEVISSADNCSLHLVRDNQALEDTAADRDVAGERAFLVNVHPVDGGLGGLEAESYVFVVPHGLLGLLSENSFGSFEDGILLLVCLLVL